MNEVAFQHKQGEAAPDTSFQQIEVVVPLIEPRRILKVISPPCVDKERVDEFIYHLSFMRDKFDSQLNGDPTKKATVEKTTVALMNVCHSCWR